jgi:uncharacterized protein
MEMAARIATLVLILFGAAALLAYAFQRTLIYYPERAALATLESLAESKDLLPWHDGDGNFLGWRSTQGTGTPILILHGNAGHSLHRSDMVSRLHDVGVVAPIYILEYPGYGARKGIPTESHLVKAALNAIDLLSQPVILLGESLGSGVACAAASQRTNSVCGLLLLTPFDSLIAVAKSHYPLVPAGLILMDRYESSRALQKFGGPLAVVMAEEDAVIPVDSAIRLFESYTGPKKLWRVTFSGHNEVLQWISDSELRSAFDFLQGRLK